MKQPDSFLEIRIHDVAASPSHTGLCVGYERGIWRAERFADHIMEWLPEFALSPEECRSISHANALRQLRNAATIVYGTDKYGKRGEFGELLLHLCVRQVFNSEPAISKLYFKSARNDTVKGFDAVHVVSIAADLELWLGEAKFYDNATAAIRDAAADIAAHLDSDYLRNEFLLISGKIDSSLPHAPQLRRLLDENTSLDTVFARCCIPVLITYDSPVVAAHTIADEAYITAFKREILTHCESFGRRTDRLPARVHLFLIPLDSKAELVRLLHERLQRWQLR